MLYLLWSAIPLGLSANGGRSPQSWTGDRSTRESLAWVGTGDWVGTRERGGSDEGGRTCVSGGGTSARLLSTGGGLIGGPSSGESSRSEGVKGAKKLFEGCRRLSMSCVSVIVRDGPAAGVAVVCL